MVADDIEKRRDTFPDCRNDLLPLPHQEVSGLILHTDPFDEVAHTHYELRAELVHREDCIFEDPGARTSGTVGHDRKTEILAASVPEIKMGPRLFFCCDFVLEIGNSFCLFHEINLPVQNLGEFREAVLEKYQLPKFSLFPGELHSLRVIFPPTIHRNGTFCNGNVFVFLSSHGMVVSSKKGVFSLSRRSDTRRRKGKLSRHGAAGVRESSG